MSKGSFSEHKTTKGLPGGAVPFSLAFSPFKEGPSDALISDWETTQSGRISPLPSTIELGVRIESQSNPATPIDPNIGNKKQFTSSSDRKVQFDDDASSSPVQNDDPDSTNRGQTQDMSHEASNRSHYTHAEIRHQQIDMESAKIESENVEAKYAEQIRAFDLKYPGLNTRQVKKIMHVGEAELQYLLHKMLGDNQDEVSAAARKLNQTVSGDDATSSALRIKLLALPMALDIICQGIIQAEEVWRATYPFGVAVRASSNQKSQRIGSLAHNEMFSVTAISLGWLKLKRPPGGAAEGWVYIGQGGKEQVVRMPMDHGKVAVIELLLTLCQLRHICLELSRKPSVISMLAFLATIAPPGKPLRDASHRLLHQLRLSRTLLHAWPAPPGRKVSSDRIVHTSVWMRAPELHALRTYKARTIVEDNSIADGDGRGTGEGGFVGEQREQSWQPDTLTRSHQASHMAIATMLPPVTALRTYTSGLRLPSPMERRSISPAVALRCSSPVSTFDWSM